MRSPAPSILGIDPGSIVTGWGLVGGPPSRPAWLDAGVIRLGGERRGLPQRLWLLHRELTLLVERLQPGGAAVESPYHGANPRSTFQLAQARGVVLAVLAGAGLLVAEYTPAAVKKAVTGNGRASKEQVRTMVGHLLGRPAPETAGDLSDALAVALCHAGSRRHAELLRAAQARR